MKNTKRLITSMAKIFTLLLSVNAVQVYAAEQSQTNPEKKRPNFLVIVADDLGYSDLGSYGGEINTPVLDQLAQKGVRYTNFYAAPTCSVTRSMLLTGTDSHIAGLGNMFSLRAPNQVGQPGYEGVLNKRVATIAEILQENGYNTYMAGKWHLGLQPDQIPHARGFQRDFSNLVGGGSHFNDGWNLEWQRPKIPYTEDGKFIKELPKDFYSTKAYTDKALKFIKEGHEDGKPFFTYLAYTAPHGPLHLPDDWLRRYKNRYDAGWDATRKERLARMEKIGIIDKDINTADRLFFLPKDSAFTPAVRVMQGRKMEIYAGMVEYMDDQIGRVFDYLKEIGEYDNTVVIFISDNGAEGNDLRAMVAGRPGSFGYLHAMNNFAEDGHNSLGRKGTYTEYGPLWAQVSMAPFRIYKGWVSEGGMRSPLIISGPGVKGVNEINKHAVLNVTDIAPTLLDLAGIEQPSTYQGRDIEPMQGKSWVSMMTGEKQSPRTADDWLGFELFTNRAIRQGDWKISWLRKPLGTEEWQLFNLISDPGEQIDRSAEFPDKRAQLITLWDEYQETNGIIIGNRSPFERLDKLMPAAQVEEDNYPVRFGIEALPYKTLMKMMNGEKETEK
jgi:arylsulfatase A-like enzyme